MRAIGLPLVLASMVTAIACSSDRALAPTAGPSSQFSGIPPELIANYTLVYLPGKGTAIALNDSGDVVGIPLFGPGILWHGAAHDTTLLPIHPTAIANDGTVAGVIDGHAATWKNGRVTILDTATSVALAFCKCESATVVGAVMVHGVSHAAIWVDGIRIDAGLPPNSDVAEFVAIGGGFVVGNASFNVLNPNPDLPHYGEPYSWSPAAGWVRLRRGPVSNSEVVAMNSHGIAVGLSVGPHESHLIYFNVGAGTGEEEFAPGPFFSEVRPTGINDSERVSATGYYVSPGGFISGIFKPLVTSTSIAGIAVLPPGGTEATTAGINNAGVIVGNQGEFEPAIWIPNR
jgi:hypothetical protein